MQQTDKFLHNFFDGLIEYTYICIKHSRILSIGKLIKLKTIPRQALIGNGGPQPSGHALHGGLQTW